MGPKNLKDLWDEILLGAEWLGPGIWDLSGVQYLLVGYSEGEFTRTSSDPRFSVKDWTELAYRRAIDFAERYPDFVVYDLETARIGGALILCSEMPKKRRPPKTNPILEWKNPSDETTTTLDQQSRLLVITKYN